MRLHTKVMLTLLAAIAAGAAYGQTDPYGPPGNSGQQDPYGPRGNSGQQDPYTQQGQYGQPGQQDQQGQYDDDWNQSDDWSNQPGNDGYDNNGYNNNGYGNNGDRFHGSAPGVDVGFFYGELSPYGEWVRHPNYGWVWFPRNVQAGWRPYSIGRWVQSDYGWTWVSYEPFGWATYHYGRWTWDRYVGWLWVPGTDWAPAWVAWQQGNGYIGWAPLPPAVGFDMHVGIQLGGFSLSVGIAPRNYAFVEERRFLDSRIGGYIEPEARNVTIIHNTTNITNYTVVNNRVINVGVPLDRVERATGRRAQRLRVAQATNARESVVDRDVVRIYRPNEAKLESVKVAQRNNAGLRQAPQQNRPAAQAPGNRPPAQTSPKTWDQGPLPVPVAPRTQPQTKPVDERRFAAEQEALRANQDKQQRALEQAQRQEKQRAGAQADAQAVEQRHAAEMKEQQILRENTAQQLKARQQIERQAAQASAQNAKGQPPPAEKPKPKNGKKANQDKPQNQDKQNENQKPPQ